MRWQMFLVSQFLPRKSNYLLSYIYKQCDWVDIISFISSGSASHKSPSLRRLALGILSPSGDFFRYWQRQHRVLE